MGSKHIEKLPKHVVQILEPCSCPHSRLVRFGCGLAGKRDIPFYLTPPQPSSMTLHLTCWAIRPSTTEKRILALGERSCSILRETHEFEGRRFRHPIFPPSLVRSTPANTVGGHSINTKTNTNQNPREVCEKLYERAIEILIEASDSASTARNPQSNPPWLGSPCARAQRWQTLPLASRHGHAPSSAITRS